jgi:hypothetical protein
VSTTPKVLLIAGNPTGVSILAARLEKRACEIHSCLSRTEANAFVSNQQFDLVISELRMWDRSSDPLATSLLGSRTTLVYAYPVETGWWWLPAVRNGQSCWGSLAMRHREFVGFLDETLEEIASRRSANSG